MDVKINILKEFRSEKATLISGLPGIAYIGKLSVDYLIRELKAELVAEVYSKYFPPYVLIRNDGVVELLRNELYFLEGAAEKGIFLFTGNAQPSSPEGQYCISNEVLDTVIRFGVQRIYSIAAFLTDRHFERPKVYGATTSPLLMREIKGYGVLPMNQGNIGGTNGLIFGLGKIKNLEGICLLGETHGYLTATGQYIVDSKAVRAVLDILTNILGLKVDMEPLDKQTKQMDALIKEIAQIEKRVRREMRDTDERARTRYIT